MKKILELVLTPRQAFGEKNYTAYAAKTLRVQPDEISGVNIIKRSIDSRSKRTWTRIQAEVLLHEKTPAEKKIIRNYQHVRNAKRVIVVGAGPAGLFAALNLLESGYKPVILERGKDVHERKKDIALISKQNKVNTDSNYCFGEGGAGTFSDGKLYTRSTKRGNVGRILETLVYFGATPDILIDSHPHLGSDKLPRIIEAMRDTILEAGGEIHFNTRVTRLESSGRTVKGLRDQKGNLHEGSQYILATGHSARDIYEMLESEKLPLEFKPFALGVRAEHPQVLIDSIQYHSKQKDPFLPAASYSLVHQASGRGVFSFCMCPGGIIVPSATDNFQVVVNGMSNSRRNSPFANSGIVVTIDPGDLTDYQRYGALMGLKFQETIEKISFLAGGSCQKSPAQRLTDFVEGKMSASLPDTSYHPGITSYPVHQVFPDFITSRLQEAFRAFDKKMPGFLTRDAIVTASESRTSSPVRIPRDPETLQYSAFDNLYPCGEGAGYSGGIISSAIDGENVAKEVAKILS
ncbi:MAG: NAD(P)/FAD-dependent oxidoreductase [Bacteroidales bacterium]